MMYASALIDIPWTMPTEVIFESVRAATPDGSEDARLVYLDRTLMALLLPAATGWYLQLSLGRREQEGLIFSTLAAAEAWVREQGGSIASPTSF